MILEETSEERLYCELRIGRRKRQIHFPPPTGNLDFPFRKWCPLFPDLFLQHFHFPSQLLFLCASLKM